MPHVAPIASADPQEGRPDEIAKFAEDAARDAEPLRVEVFETLEAAEPVWRAFEETAVMTAYQRFDWIRTFVATHGIGKGRLAIAALFDGSQPIALLPLVVTARLGVRSARLIGWGIGNADWMMLDRAALTRLDREALDRFFAEIARRTDADLLALHSQPEAWGGVANPLLVFPHQPSPDHFYGAKLGTERLNAKRIRNIERGKRRLEETLGPVRLVRAATPEAIVAVHAEFLRQRGLRFREMGIAKVFAAPWFADFFRAAAREGLTQGRPVMALHSLYAGETIVATSCGCYCGTHFSQYINSTTDGPAAKYSLMGILMLELVAELRRNGVEDLDMGLGDFDYKLDWTDKHTAWDAVIPLSLRGRVASAALLGARRVKRAIKQNDRLWTFVRTVRALPTRRKDQPPAA